MSHNYLIHSSGPWKKHKYIKKVGDKYYYVYDMPSYNKYNNSQKEFAEKYEAFKNNENEKTENDFMKASEKANQAYREFAGKHDEGRNIVDKTILKGINVGDNVLSKAKQIKGAVEFHKKTDAEKAADEEAKKNRRQGIWIKDNKGNYVREIKVGDEIKKAGVNTINKGKNFVKNLLGFE